MANISRAEAQQISAEITAAIAGIFAKHNLEARPTKSGYGDFYTYKVEAVSVQTGRNGVNIASKEAVFFAAMGASIGLTAADLGAVFTANGEQWTLTGARNSEKYPLIATRNATGKTHMLPESPAVIAAIKAAR
jgi:hypothetical protein